MAACDVAPETSGSKVAGYHALAAAGILLTDLPESLAGRLPRHPSVKVARAYGGRRLGAALLWDAIERSPRSEMYASTGRG